MNEDFSADLLTLVDEAGQEHEFEILDIIENDAGCFYALLPSFDDPQEQVESEGTYYIFQAFEEDGEQQLAEVEDEDLLEAGIQIIAQPPGKKLQNMMQLSGGEKALTAIALLFAIQNLKPSPFCLLD